MVPTQPMPEASFPKQQATATCATSEQVHLVCYINLFLTIIQTFKLCYFVLYVQVNPWVLRRYGIYPRLVIIPPEGGINNQPRGCPVSPRIPIPWVNHYIICSQGNSNQNSESFCVTRLAPTMGLFVLLLPKPKTLSVPCCLTPYSLAEVCCHNEQLLLSLLS